VVEVVGYVSEVGSPRFQLFDNREALLDGEVGRMRPVTERVNYENIQSLEYVPTLFRDFTDICAISNIVDPKPEDGEASVMEADGSDRGAQQRERLGGNAFKMQSRSGATVVVGRWVSEGIVVRTANLVFDRLLAVQGDRAVEVLSENPQVVESENVVSVVVGEHRSVDKVNPFPNELKA
jgi:hypothetical protein